MSADNGFRFGSKPEMWPTGGDWVYVKGKHPSFEEIRKDDKNLRKIDDYLLRLEMNTQKIVDLVRFMRLLLLGGHVRKDKYAQAKEHIDENADIQTTSKAMQAAMDKYNEQIKAPFA